MRLKLTSLPLQIKSQLSRMDMQNQIHHFINLISTFTAVSRDSSAAKSTVLPLTASLTELTKKPYFFDIVFHVLGSQEVGKDELIIITSLMKDTLRFEFQRVKEVEGKVAYIHAGLCSIMNKYREVVMGAAFGNLSLCIAYIYINLAATSNVTAIDYLKGFLSEESNPNYFFKILQLIAQEVGDSKLVIDQQTRNSSQEKFKEQQQPVLIQLNTLADAAWKIESIHHSYIISAFGSWIDVCYNQQVLNNLPDHFVMQAVFKSLHQDKDAEAAIDCLSIIINKIRNPTQNQKIFMYLAQNIFGLLPILDQLIGNFEMTDADQYIEILCEFGCKSAQLFVTKYDQNLDKFMDRIIFYLSNDFFDCINDVANYFDIFFKEIYHQQKIGNHQLSPLLFSTVKKAHRALCKKYQYSWRHLNDLNLVKEEKLQQTYGDALTLSEHRSQGEQIFQTIGKVLGKEGYLNFVIESILQLPRDNPEKFYPAFESTLLSLKQPLKRFPYLSEDVMKLVNLYNEHDAQMTMIKVAYLRIFESLFTIQDKHDEAFIKNLFVFTCSCFDSYLLVEIAEDTFLRGCKENAHIICQNIGEIIEVVKKYSNRVAILKGAISLLNTSPSMMNAYLPELLGIQLQTLANTKPEEILKRKSAFHCLFMLIKSINCEDENLPYAPIIKSYMKQMWPHLKFMLQHPQELKDDEDAEVQRCAKVLKVVMRCLKLDFSEFLPEMFETVVQAFKKYPICSYIYILEVSITVFYKIEMYSDYFKNLYIQFCQITYGYLTKQQNYEKYAFLVDDFIGMNKRFFIFNASIVLESGQLPSVLKLCIDACMGSDTPRVAKASYSFFQTIFMVYWRNEFIAEYNTEALGDKFEARAEDHSLHLQLKKYLASQIEYVLIKMIEHLSRVPVEITGECILEAIMSELKAFTDENPQVWTNILIKIPTDILTRKEKDKIMLNIENIKSANFTVCSQAEIALRRSVYNLNKRLINASKRTTKFQFLQ